MARVTVIDDSPLFLTLMRDVLETLGHEMTEVPAVEPTVAAVAASAPDVLIIDLRMQGRSEEMSGWELIRLARSQRQFVDVPIILCTGDVHELRQRMPEVQQLHNVEVLTKPFTREDLKALLERVLPGSTNGSAVDDRGR